MSKINITCLHGLFCNGPESVNALRITGDADTIILTKGPALAGWLTDNTKIVVEDRETTVKDENMHQVQQLMAKWLRGEELDV